MKTPATLLRVLFGTSLFFATMLPIGTPTALERSGSHAAEGDHGAGLSPLEPDCLPKDPPPPVVKLRVRVPACSEPGQAITYRICVENCSTAEAHHVTVKDALPASAKFVRSEPAPAKQGPELQWNLGTIGGGAVREIILVLQPTGKEDVKNCLRVQFEHGVCLVTRQSGYAFPPMPGVTGVPGVPGDIGKEPPPKVTTVPEATLPVLDLVIRGQKEQYANLATRYDITVTNTGKAKATNLQVSSAVSNKLKIVKASNQGAVAENTVAWNLGTLEPGASRVLELTLQAKEAGDLCFTTTALADLGVKVEKEACTKFVGVSAMTIEMYDRDDPIFLGDKNSYLVFVRNQGSAPLTSILVKAFIPDSMKLERANASFERKGPVKGGEWLDFTTLPKIEVGETRRYEIFVEAVQAGVTRFHVEVMADQLDNGRPVIEQELTTIVDDREKAKVRSLSRAK